MPASPRRRFLQLLGLSSVGAFAAARAQDAARTPELPSLNRGRDGVVRFALDMAVLGHTDAPNTAGRIDDPKSTEYFRLDSRGDSYFYEGLLYPGGTIPAPTKPTPLSVFPNAPGKLNNEVVWDFTRAKPTGHFLNRGWVLINGNPTPYRDSRGTEIEGPRREPHLLSDHTFVLGIFGPKSLSPEMLQTSGVENGNDPDTDVVVRAVTGGTGRFRHASGQVTQTRVGRNTSVLRSFAKMGNVMSPNYRFEFELRLD
jgi:hypothetical protein